MIPVLVCGGRCFKDTAAIAEVLDQVHATRGIGRLIHGNAAGADRLAEAWAQARGIPTVACPADWAKYGLRAGPIRNSQMLAEHRPQLVVAFPGGPGTADMVRQARIEAVEVYQPEGLR